MTEALPAPTAPTLPVKTLAEFLESTPPNSRVAISDLTAENSFNFPRKLRSPDVQLHCWSEKCNGTRVFRSKSLPNPLTLGWSTRFLTYLCANCEQSYKTFAVAAYANEDDFGGVALKFGESPPFGPHVPARVITLIGPDRQEYLLGLQAESRIWHGSAFTLYHRRNLENQKAESWVRSRESPNASWPMQEKLRLLNWRHQETRFNQAVEGD